MPEHKKRANSIATKHNYFGSPHANRTKWLAGAGGAKPAAKADVLYFVGCSASYTNPEIAQATARILGASGMAFTMMEDEWCCGNELFSVGQIDDARKLAERNLKIVRDSGAKVLMTTCAEGYRMWKVDYPKMLGIATADLGFEVVHLVELVSRLMKEGKIELTQPVNMRLAYHDSCSLSRLSEPWQPWEGERGLWGVVTPTIERRRGTNGVYQPPRDILASIPGVQLVEFIRMKENAFCCGAGRGVKEAFPDFAAWAGNERLVEAKTVGAEGVVSTCPWCKNNFVGVARKNGDDVKAYDISELILAAMKA
jgi:Fe-S oxidoreductase